MSLGNRVRGLEEKKRGKREGSWSCQSRNCGPKTQVIKCYYFEVFLDVRKGRWIPSRLPSVPVPHM